MKTYTVQCEMGGEVFEGTSYDTEREAQTEVYNLQLEFPDTHYWYEIEGEGE